MLVNLLAASWAVVVVAESPSVAPANAPPSVMTLRARTALRGGLGASGGTVLADSPELAKLADAKTGACDAECEKKMIAKAQPAALLLARLAVAGDRFALQVSAGSQVSSSSGLLADLESAAAIAANAVARPEASLVVEGAAANAPVLVDGVPAAPNAKGVIPVAPGRRLVRIGDGQGAGAIRAVEALPGQVVTVSFASGADGAKRKPLALAGITVPLGGAASERSIVSPSATRENSARGGAGTGSQQSWARSPWTWAAAGAAVLAGGAAAAYASDARGGGSGATRPYTTVEIDE